MPIPNRLVFVWFGREFPYGNLLALQSARRQCNPEEILLIAEHPEGIRSRLGPVGDWPQLKILPASPDWFDGLPPGGKTALEVFESSSHAPTKSNLLRLAALYRHGGVYLDFDTITIRDLAPLRREMGFCGTERVVFPASFHARRNPGKWISAGLLSGLREICARAPGGWRAFRRIEWMYALAANNAVLGMEPGHPLLARCFRSLESVPPGHRHRRFRLGTHLLQAVTGSRSGPDFSVLPPAAFYPLGPEISNHWFRRGTAESLPDMILPPTYIVHWYNSVEGRFLKQAVTREWIDSHEDTAMTALVRRFC